jgi:hypothetical protein
MEISSVNLRGKIERIGPIQFVSAEWTEHAPQFVLLRYELSGRAQKFGVRLDLDKRMVMEDLEDPELNKDIRKLSGSIWEVVVNEIAVLQAE